MFEQDQHQRKDLRLNRYPHAVRRQLEFVRVDQISVKTIDQVTLVLLCSRLGTPSGIIALARVHDLTTIIRAMRAASGQSIYPPP